MRPNLFPRDKGHVQQKMPVYELAQSRRRRAIRHNRDIHVGCAGQGNPVRKRRYRSNQVGAAEAGQPASFLPYPMLRYIFACPAGVGTVRSGWALRVGLSIPMQL